MDTEEILWELAGMETHDAGRRDLPESDLRAYRSGGMSDPESDRVEGLLIASMSQRRRLEALAGVRILPPASVRARLFGDAAIPVQGQAGVAVMDPSRSAVREGQARPPWRAIPSRGAAAASIAALVLLGVWALAERGLLPGIDRVGGIGEKGSRSPSALPEYRVEIAGTASMRSDAGRPEMRTHDALPETVVEISLLPQTAPSEPVEFGLYRRWDGGLRRVPERDMLAAVVNRGAASLKLEARSLVGETAGTRAFFIVVSKPGRLPDELPVSGPGTSSAVEALRAVSGGRIYERTITVAAGTPGGTHDR